MKMIRPLALEEINGELRGMLQPTVDRLGYFGAFFQYGSHAPDVLAGFMRMSGALKAALPDDLNETAALVVCTAMDFAYERIQHERLCEKLGFDRTWIAFLTGQGAQVDLTASQQAVRDLSVALVEGRHADARDIAGQLAELESEQVAVAMLFQVTRFMQVCTIGKTLDMRIGVDSIFAGSENT